MSARVAAELSAIRPWDDIERAHLEDAIAWANSGAQLCRLEKPATPAKHLVAYFAVIDGDRMLLVDHRAAQLWLPTGGHVEPDEDPRVTVVRELQEELGLDIPLERIGPPLMVTVTNTVGLTPGHTDVSLWYTVNANQHQPLSFSREEFHEVRWFDLSAAPLGRSDPHLSRFIAKLRTV
ncbi:MAG: NUDIX domain-containing protein [Pseudomonadota bacterium]